MRGGGNIAADDSPTAIEQDPAESSYAGARGVDSIDPIFHQNPRPYPHTTKNIWSCSEQNCIFSVRDATKENLPQIREHHVWLSHGFWQCPECSFWSVRADEVDTHALVDHNDKMMVCSFSCCEERFFCEDLIEHHQRTVHEQPDSTEVGVTMFRPFLCGVNNCATRYPQRAQIKRHLKQDHQLSWARWKVFCLKRGSVCGGLLSMRINCC